MQATGEIKNIFLQEIKNRTTYENSSSTTTSSTTASSSTKRIKVQNQKITTMFDNIKIDIGKEKRCNRALTRFFVCCGLPFHIISNPFFVNFVKYLCPSYNLPNRVTFASNWINIELAQVTCTILDILRDSKNITLGLFTLFIFL
jgi:hypothetical protein